MKTCTRCGQAKSRGEFRPLVKSSDGIGSWCRECCRAACRRSREKYGEIYNMRRRMPPAIRGTCTECGLEFLTAHPERLVCSSRCRNRRRHRRIMEDPARAARYRETRRGRGSSKDRRRRKLVSGGDLTASDVRTILTSRTFCPLCRKRMTNERGRRQKHLDHIVPIAVGGTHTWGNVRVICASCNLSRPYDASDVPQETLWARAYA